MGQRHHEVERRATEIENVVWLTFQEHVQQRTVVELVGGTVSQIQEQIIEVVVTPGEHESKRFVEEAVEDPVHVPANAGADKEHRAADQGQMSLESPTNVQRRG